MSMINLCLHALRYGRTGLRFIVHIISYRRLEDFGMRPIPVRLLPSEYLGRRPVSRLLANSARYTDGIFEAFGRDAGALAYRFCWPPLYS